MVAIYCHSCSTGGTGYVNVENEMECMRCGSTFVEESGQEGLETFRQISPEGSVTGAGAVVNDFESGSDREEGGTRDSNEPPPLVPLTTRSFNTTASSASAASSQDRNDDDGEDEEGGDGSGTSGDDMPGLVSLRERAQLQTARGREATAEGGGSSSSTAGDRRRRSGSGGRSRAAGNGQSRRPIIERILNHEVPDGSDGSGSGNLRRMPGVREFVPGIPAGAGAGSGAVGGMMQAPAQLLLGLLNGAGAGESVPARTAAGAADGAALHSGPPSAASIQESLFASIIENMIQGEGTRGMSGMMNGFGSAGAGADLGEILHHILMNENSHPGAPPATEDTIKTLERIAVTAENVTELDICYITQEPFEVGGTALRLPCKHVFQPESLEKWLRMHNTCPTCREPVQQKDSEGATTTATTAAAGSGATTSASSGSHSGGGGRGSRGDLGNIGTRMPFHAGAPYDWNVPADAGYLDYSMEFSLGEGEEEEEEEEEEEYSSDSYHEEDEEEDEEDEEHEEQREHAHLPGGSAVDNDGDGDDSDELPELVPRGRIENGDYNDVILSMGSSVRTANAAANRTRPASSSRGRGRSRGRNGSSAFAVCGAGADVEDGGSDDDMPSLVPLCGASASADADADAGGAGSGAVSASREAWALRRDGANESNQSSTSTSTSNVNPPLAAVFDELDQSNPFVIDPDDRSLDSFESLEHEQDHP